MKADTTVESISKLHYICISIKNIESAVKILPSKKPPGTDASIVNYTKKKRNK